MDRRSFLAATALAATGTAAPKTGGAAASKTYVLVHGAWHGGWCWSKVASILRGRGHTVLTPTQTGLGERAHLLSKSIDLDVFVTDRREFTLLAVRRRYGRLARGRSQRRCR